MSLNTLIIKTLNDIAPVYPDVCNDDSQERYFVFNYNSWGGEFADDEPEHDIDFVQIHFFCPLKENTVSLRNTVKKRLRDAGFTHPSYTNITDETGQHLVFECEYAEAVE